MTPDAASIAIRRAIQDDLPSLIELLAAGGLRPGKEAPNDLDAYSTALAEIDDEPHNCVLVAVDGSTVIGACQLIAFRHLQEHGGLSAEIESMHVAAPRRNTGLGSRLLVEAVDVAREWGCYRIQLTSHTSRDDAHRFYRNHGFEPTHVGFKRRL